MEDKWARDFLTQQAKDKKNDIAFYDFSVKDPFDKKWKTECKKKIAMTKGTIVLIGETTYRSEAVLWEIEDWSSGSLSVWYSDPPGQESPDS